MSFPLVLWCFRFAISENAATPDVRNRVVAACGALAPWRAVVVTSLASGLSVTCSLSGRSQAEAVKDAGHLLQELGVEDMPGLEKMEIFEPGYYRTVGLPLFAGVAEVAEMLGVSRQYVSRSAKRGARWLPAPIAQVSATPLWIRDEIAEIAKQRSLGGTASTVGGSKANRAKSRKVSATTDSSVAEVLGEEASIYLIEH